MIIGNEFEAYLNVFEYKNIEESIESHITLVYENSEVNQNFLSSLDETFNTSYMSNFNDPNWKSINFPIAISNLNLEFGGLNFKCQLLDIKISKIETSKELKTKYLIRFRLDEVKTLESMKIEMALKEFLRRKDTDSKGKKSLVKFKTKISKLF